jgi:hypothetical protein
MREYDIAKQVMTDRRQQADNHRLAKYLKPNDTKFNHLQSLINRYPLANKIYLLIT